MHPKDIERFCSKIKVAGNCWEWTASLDRDGYGRFSVKHKNISAHRFSYGLFNEDIPEGLQIDHLCRNRKCVNPLHLEAVPLQENIKRGLTGKINHWREHKTHCPYGHEYTQGKNQRICKTCKNRANQKLRLKIKINNLNNTKAN